MNTVIFQAARFRDLQKLQGEAAWARSLLDMGIEVERVFGVSGGALTATAFALDSCLKCNTAPHDNSQPVITGLEGLIRAARKRHFYAWNLNPWYGFYNLKPLLRWVSSWLKFVFPTARPADLLLSQLPVQLYLCAIDSDGTFTMFGQPNPDLNFQYHAVHVGPPIDAPLIDALSASLSTLLSTSPALVNGNWYRDCRPAIVDASAIVYDLLRNGNPRISSTSILRMMPHAPVLNWKQNWFTSSFIMHSQNERNQTLLAQYYLDLQYRREHLEHLLDDLLREYPEHVQALASVCSPIVRHVDLPYVGSTEAFTNMRQSVENKGLLMARFRDLLQGQLDEFPFNATANVIYGAGGFSGILAGLVTTRAVDSSFEAGGGHIQQIYGVSAGVLNGFFHAVQVAASRYPDLYKPPAQQSLTDLENFIATIAPRKVACINYKPNHFWRGWANLTPLRRFILECLAKYTGSQHPEQITFNDIALPMTIAAARLDGFTDFLGMTTINRTWHIGAKQWRVLNFPIADAILAGWSMNTYIIPAQMADQTYTDGGGTFYDPALFVACMDDSLTSLLNIHLDEPDGHSYNIPPKPNLLRILFDTHNYVFPEECRRMRALTDLLYQFFDLRDQYHHIRLALSNDLDETRYPAIEDFRQTWQPKYALPINAV